MVTDARTWKNRSKIYKMSFSPFFLIFKIGIVRYQSCDCAYSNRKLIICKLNHNSLSEKKREIVLFAIVSALFWIYSFLFLCIIVQLKSLRTLTCSLVFVIHFFFFFFHSSYGGCQVCLTIIISLPL